ncbi:recombination regulator RecX [Pelodictyon luteolum]|uniref:Regulatory protein RecX n=1 Tax=Chlorobium luteolum (strain DSM 273 / BCRC 81028 / 2530) TaxID=319225 RepID=Q3B5T7_CHLL3|nr:recombination regulator RecX [Pelodictyon luteolum]ABB23294.1 regulatory protein RecX [Pelodictyon luteolum DSM 273]
MYSRRNAPRGQAALESSQSLASAHAFKLLGLRSHSQMELETKLKKKGFEGAHIAGAIERLKELKLIDDRAFAEEFLRSRSRMKQAGRMKLRMELRKRGISDAIIDVLLKSHDTSAPCLEAAKKKMRALGSSPGVREKEKLVRFLQGRGFMWEEIRETLQVLMPGSGGRSPLPDNEEEV